MSEKMKRAYLMTAGTLFPGWIASLIARSITSQREIVTLSTIAGILIGAKLSLSALNEDN